MLFSVGPVDTVWEALHERIGAKCGDYQGPPGSLDPASIRRVRTIAGEEGGIPESS